MAAHAIDNNLSAPHGVEPRYRDYETRLDRRSDISPDGERNKSRRGLPSHRSVVGCFV